MSNWRYYTWALPIIGAIFAFISIATPALDTLKLYDHFLEESYSAPLEVWMIGFWEMGPYDGWVSSLSLDLGIPFGATLTPFLVCFFGLLLGAILGINSGITGYRKNFKRNITAISGIIMIGFTILFIIWVEVEWSPFSGGSYLDEWDDLIDYKFDPGFGVIGPFIGGVFCIAGAFLPPEERNIQTISKPSKMGVSSTIQYCSECGFKSNGKYCPKCGTSMIR
jgi:hypothetical protein